MWNPAAAGAPPPIANPLQGAPATQQFWPQWQAYYQATAATTTDSTNEAASSGGDPVVWMEKAAQWAKQKKEEEDALKQQQQHQLQQLLQQQQQLQQLQQQQQQMLEQQMQVLTQTNAPPQQSQQSIDPAPLVQPQQSHWTPQQQPSQQQQPPSQSILQTIMQQSSSHTPPPAAQQQWPSSHDRSHDIMGSHDAMRSHDMIDHGHQQSWRDQYHDNTSGMEQYQQDPPPSMDPVPADSRPGLLETPTSEIPQGQARQGGPPSRGRAGHQPRMHSGPRGGTPPPHRGGRRGRGEDRFQPHDIHIHGPRSRGSRPPHRYGPARGGHPRNHPRQFEDTESEQHQDRYTEDETVDHFRSDRPLMGRPNQPKPLIDSSSPRPLFEHSHHPEHSDYRVPQRNADAHPDPYYDERRDTQPKPLLPAHTQPAGKPVPTSQPQPFVHPLLARARQKRMEEMSGDLSRQAQPVKMEETSRTFVHPLLAKSAAATGATVAGQPEDQEQKYVVKTEPNDSPAFMPRQVRVNQLPVIKTESSDDIDSQLYQSFEVAQDDVKLQQASVTGGWKPVVSTSEDKLPLVHPITYKKEEDMEIPGLELTSSRKSSTLDVTAVGEWKQQSLQDDVPQVVNTVEVVSEPFTETGAPAVSKVEKQEQQPQQQMIVETKGQYSFSSRPAEQEEEKHVKIEQEEATDKPKEQQQQQKKPKKVTGKEFLLGSWERVWPNQQQQNDVEVEPPEDLMQTNKDQLDFLSERPPEEDNPADTQPPPAVKEAPPERHSLGQREWVDRPPHQPPRDSNFPPDHQRPPEREYPPDRRPPERDFPPRRRPPDYNYPSDRRPPERDFPLDRRPPPERDFPPDRRPPERDFPPDRRPPERDFPPDRRPPPERDFPPDRRPPERDFPPDRRPPERDYYLDRRPEWDFPSGRRPPEWDFPPDRRPPYFHDHRPPDRGFPHDRIPPGRDFPLDQRPPERFPPDRRRDFPPDQRSLDRDFPIRHRPPERNFPFDRRQGDYPPDRRFPPERDFPPDRRPPPERDFPPDQRPSLDRRSNRELPGRDFPLERNRDVPPVSVLDRLDYGPPDQGVHQRPSYREHPPGRPPTGRPPDQEWPLSDRMPPRRWSPGKEHDWPPSDHRGRSPPREWSQKSSHYGEEVGMHPRPEGSYNNDVPLPRDVENKSGDVPSSASDASVHEAVAQLAEQMKSVKGLASKLNLPNSPKTAKEWQEVAKMVAAAAAAGGSQQKGQQTEEDDTQKRVAAMLANDSDDSDTENTTEVKRTSPAREFDGTYIIPPEFNRSSGEEERQCFSMDYGHGPQYSHRSRDYPPDDPYHHDHPPYWDDREFERLPPDRPYHRPLSPRPRLPPDYKGVPPPHSGYPLPSGDWYEGSRPRTPPYPQYGPPLPHDIPSSMLDEMTSDQQLLLAAAVNSGSDSKKKGLPTWLKEGLEQLEREKQRKAEQEATKKKRKTRWSDALTDEDESTSEGNKSLQESDEELQAALVATVRRLLTEILLSVTNSEISAVVRECMEEEETKFKFKIPPLPKRALKKTSILGLGHYDSDSGSEGSNEDDKEKGKWVPLPELPNKPAPGMSVKQIAEAFATGKSKEGGSSSSKKKKRSRWSSPEPSKKSRSSSSSKHSSSKSKSKSRYKH